MSSSWWSALTGEELLRLQRRAMASLALAFPALPPADREDLVQDAMLALLRSRDPGVTSTERAERYVLVAARHLALDRLKSHAHRDAEPLPEDLAQPLAAALALPEPDLRDEIEKKRRIFCELVALDRLILWRYVVEGATVQAIARETELNWHRVSERLSSALGLLRRRMSERET